MKIYTRTGDNGTTSLPGGERTSKTDERIEFYGVMDELNSYLGLLSSLMNEGQDKDFVEETQIILFRIGNIFVGSSAAKVVCDSDVARLESEIDRIRQNCNNLLQQFLNNAFYNQIAYSNYVDYVEANTLEKIEATSAEMMLKLKQSYKICGTLNCGGDLL